MRRPPALSLASAPRDTASFPDTIARLLTVDDHSAPAYLLRREIGENSLRATRSDLDYLKARSLTRDGKPLAWPRTKEIGSCFIAHRLWGPDQRVVDPNHGVPSYVRDALKRGVDHPFATPKGSKTLRAANCASNRHKSKEAKRVMEITRIEELLEHLVLDLGCTKADVKQVTSVFISGRAFLALTA